MNKQISKLLYGVVIAEVVVGLVLGFMAYFVRSFDRVTGMMARRQLLTHLLHALFLGPIVFGLDSYFCPRHGSVLGRYGVGVAQLAGVEARSKTRCLTTARGVGRRSVAPFPVISGR
jgi:hypothetical protein